MKYNHLISGLNDETGELAAALTEKYLYSAEMGNLQSMTPGMTDVIFCQWLSDDSSVSICFFDTDVHGPVLQGILPRYSHFSFKVQPQYLLVLIRVWRKKQPLERILPATSSPYASR